LTIWKNSTARITRFPIGLYLIGRNGRVAYRGGPGPFGFVASELERAIEKYLASAFK
jgi:hypothetical protein